MLLSYIFRAATPENPRFSLNDPSAVDAFLDGGASSSGMRVSRTTALTLPAFWRGVNLLSNYVAKLPLYIYKRQGDGKERDTAHPAYPLVRWKPQPNPAMPLLAYTWKQTVMGHALTRGNGYSYIMRDGLGEPTELLILDPDVTFPVRENGRLWYVTSVNGEQRKLRPEDVHHIHGLGFDGVQGYDVISFAKEALGRSAAQQKYSAIYFRNAAKPSVVLMHPATLTDPARNQLRNDWERMQGGLDNAHRTAILDRGLSIKELTINARDSQLIEREKFALVDIANILGLPVHKLGGDGTTAYASLEQENQSMLDDTLDPWLIHWEEETREKLLTEQQKDEDTHVVEFMRQALVRANLVDRANYYRTALGGRPWMLPDEVRGLENQNPLGGEAAEYLNPLNMGQGGAANDPEPPGAPTPKKAAPADTPPEDDAEAQAVQTLLADARWRLTKRIAASAEKAAREPKTFTDWVDGFAGEHSETIARVLAPLGQLLGDDRLAACFARDVVAPYAEVAERATARTLAAEVAKLNTELEARYARP